MRVVKKHEDRKNEILDAAQQLFYQQGYENTSVANVIDAVKIAKGTFYHYFKSKDELLDQIIERIVHHIDAIIDKVLEEPEENAIVELNNMYREIGQYKVQKKEVFIMMTKAMYREENLTLRTKLSKQRVITVRPQLTKVIERGISEGLFHTENPDNMAELILNMGLPLGDRFAGYVLNNELNTENKKEYIELCEAYNTAVQRILGAPKDSIQLFDMDTIKKFFE